MLLPKRVVMETLAIQNMLKNRHLSKAIGNQCLYEWIRQMKYKCERYGIEFVQAEKQFPSSKTCHNCRNEKTIKCGFTIDRDYNAALNLMSYIG